MLRRPLIIVLIAVLLSIILGALMFFFLVSPKNKEKDKVLTDIQTTDTQISAERAKNKTLVDIKNKSAEYEARLAAAQAMIPQQPELPSLIRMLQAAADPETGADVPWLSFTPSDVGSSAAGAAPAAGSTGVSTYSFGLSVAGFYDDITEFIYRIERFQRAVIVDSVALTPTNSILTTTYDPNLGLIQAQISARTFTFMSPPGAAGSTASPTTPVVPSSSPTSSPSSTP